MIDDFVSSLGGRIDAMAKMHSRLSQSNWSGISLRTLAEDALAPYRIEGRAELGGPEIILRPAATQAMAMVFHELGLTNAAKYGSLSAVAGKVRVSWQECEWKSEKALSVVWQELDGPLVKAPGREGYGSTVIRELVRYEIGGATTLTFEDSGVISETIVPFSNVLDAQT